MTDLKSLILPHGTLPLPAYLPDATHGMVRGADSSDMEEAGVEALVMNVYHLMQRPGSATIQALGGLHKMAGWSRPIMTDSGGFQAYSLLKKNPGLGSITDQGLRLKPEGSDHPLLLSPEKSVQLQLSYGADIVVCLDDCTEVGESEQDQILAVERTLKWAKRCRKEFDMQSKQRRFAQEARPLLFGVVQGGSDLSLRRLCAEGLPEIGFDGYGFGGWPLDADGKLLIDLLAATRALIPAHIPMHALGVGSPSALLAAARAGYNMFDCALPTRDARTGRLYKWRTDPNSDGFTLSKEAFDTLYIDDERHIRSAGPLSPGCICLACRRYSTGYLRHLRRCNDALYTRLATLHNLSFMTQLITQLRREQSAEAPAYA